MGEGGPHLGLGAIEIGPAHIQGRLGPLHPLPRAGEAGFEQVALALGLGLVASQSGLHRFHVGAGRGDVVALEIVLRLRVGELRLRRGEIGLRELDVGAVIVVRDAGQQVAPAHGLESWTGTSRTRPATRALMGVRSAAR